MEKEFLKKTPKNKNTFISIMIRGQEKQQMVCKTLFGRSFGGLVK
jgi:hypothetical protein